jgi:STE24 endopeptidase
MALANKAGVKVLDIYNIALSEKTKKANAALCGLGSTKRILISDTLINDYTSDEIETTIGHEIAHYKYRHFWKLSFYNLLFTLIGLGLAAVLLQQMVSFGYIKEAYNIKSLPVLAILYILYSVIITPVMNRISCYYEKEADLAAIGLTNKPQAFIGLINKLTLQNLSDPQPALLIELFFYDHPPAKKRVKIAHLLEK